MKVVRHWLPAYKTQAVSRFSFPSSKSTPITQPDQKVFNQQHRLVAIGASTGGPSALSIILRNLPDDFNWPILITQHIMPGFGKGLAQWLGQTTGRKVVLAVEGMPVEIDSSQVILAPDDCHLRLNAQQQLVFDKSGLVNGILPSVDVMFESISQNITGNSVVGVLLTGMGKDGATGLKLLREMGATTIVQDEASSIVFGMPKEAIALGAAERVLPLSKIPEELVKLSQS